MKTAIITACHNHLDVTKKFLNSINSELNNENYSLYILDNGGTDGTYEYLKEFSKTSNIKMHVYKSIENLGFAGGNNLLLKDVLNKVDISNIILLNNDTLVTKESLNLLVQACDTNKLVGASGPISNYVSGRQRVYIEGLTDKNYAQYAKRLAKSDQIHADEVGLLIGFCMCIKKEVLQNIGLLDETFTIGMYEDNDLCLRIRNAGYKLAIIKESLIYHYGSQTIKDYDYANLLEKNKQIFLNKYKPQKAIMMSQIVTSPTSTKLQEQDVPTYYFESGNNVPQELLIDAAQYSEWILLINNNAHSITCDLNKLKSIIFNVSPEKDLILFKIAHIKDGKLDLKRGADWQGRLLRLRKRIDGSYINFNEVPLDARDYTYQTIVELDDPNDKPTEATMKQFTISASLIVKNEEQYVGRCMESIKDLVNEIVIVDTGSTDKTIDICKKYTNNIYAFPWNDSFSDARNCSLEHCTKDWILRIDGDEEVPTMTKVNIYNAIINNEADALLTPIHNLQPNGSYEISSTIRIFKNNPSYRYTGRVHEEIDSALHKEHANIMKLNNHFLHYGYLKGIQPQKSAFYLKLLMLDYKDDPNNFKTNMNLANYYYHHNNYQTAVEFYKETIRLLGDSIDPIVYHDYAIASYKLFLLKHKSELQDILGIMDKAVNATKVCYPEQIERFKKNYNLLKSLIIDK